MKSPNCRCVTGCSRELRDWRSTKPRSIRPCPECSHVHSVGDRSPLPVSLPLSLYLDCILSVHSVDDRSLLPVSLLLSLYLDCILSVHSVVDRTLLPVSLPLSLYLDCTKCSQCGRSFTAASEFTFIFIS